MTRRRNYSACLATRCRQTVLSNSEDGTSPFGRPTGQFVDGRANTPNLFGAHTESQGTAIDCIALRCLIPMFSDRFDRSKSVKNNNHRPISVEEFQGFALVDTLAPPRECLMVA